VDRRTFLQLAATGLAFSGPAFGLRARADRAPSLGGIGYQLSWIKNFQFAGEYIAESRKYYQKFGLQVDLLGGGPSISADPIVASGRVLIGQSSPENTANAVEHGAALKCIGAQYQKILFCIISLSKSGLLTPKDMIGRKIGIQTANLVVWRSFLKLNKIDPASVQVVPVQFDLSPLIEGAVEGFFGYANDDFVQVKAKGYDVRAMLFADFGYKMFTGIYVVATDSLTDKTKRAQLVAFMKGDIMGWQDALKDPTLGANLTVEVYGKGNGLDLGIQEAACRASNWYMTSPDTDKHGLLWMGPTAIEDTIATLSAAGVKAAPDMFTTEILEEAYGGRNTI